MHQFYAYYLTKNKKKADSFDDKRFLFETQSQACLQQIAAILDIQSTSTIAIKDITAEQIEAIQKLTFDILIETSEDLNRHLKQLNYQNIGAEDETIFWGITKSIEDIKRLQHIFSDFRKGNGYYRYFKMA